MTVKRNSRNVSTVSCTFKGKNLRKHLFHRKKKAKNGGLVFVYGNNEPLVYNTV